MLKSVHFVNFTAFFDGFTHASHADPFVATLIFEYMKGVEVGHMSCKFHLHFTCNSL